MVSIVAGTVDNGKNLDSFVNRSKKHDPPFKRKHPYIVTDIGTRFAGQLIGGIQIACAVQLPSDPVANQGSSLDDRNVVDYLFELSLSIGNPPCPRHKLTALLAFNALVDTIQESVYVERFGLTTIGLVDCRLKMGLETGKVAFVGTKVGQRIF